MIHWECLSNSRLSRTSMPQVKGVWPPFLSLEDDYHSDQQGGITLHAHVQRSPHAYYSIMKWMVSYDEAGRELLRRQKWLRIHSFKLPKRYDSALANGYNGWSVSPIITRDQRLKREDNPAQEPFGDHHLYLPDEKTGRLHSWSFTYLSQSFSKDEAQNQPPDEKLGCPLIAATNEEQHYALFEIDLISSELSVCWDLAQRAWPEVNGRRSERYFIGSCLIPTQVIKATSEADCLYTQESTPTSNDHQTPPALSEAVQLWRSELKHLPRLKVASNLYGYCSWYYRYQNIHAQWLRENLDALDASTHQGHAGRVQLFQVDDGYQKGVGDWLTSSPRFRGKIETFFEEARTSHPHLTFGIWCAPFVASRTSQLVGRHPEWLLRDPDNKVIECGNFPHWGGPFYALDTENTGVINYLSFVFAKFFKECGCRFLKADFLYSAAHLSRKNLTRAERMNRAMNFLLEQCRQHGAQLLACGSVLASTYGRAHFCRIGPDVEPSWQNAQTDAFSSREKCSTPHSLINAVTRGCLDQQMFGNDPDVFILRKEDNALNAQQKQLLCDINHRFGSLISTSDLMSAWHKEEHEVAEQANKQRQLSMQKGPSSSHIHAIRPNSDATEQSSDRAGFRLDYQVVATDKTRQVFTEP